MPLVRAIFPYAAGVAADAIREFLPLTTLGSIPWIAGLAAIGKAVGSNWPHWRHNLDYVDYAALVVLVAAIV